MTYKLTKAARKRLRQALKQEKLQNTAMELQARKPTKRELALQEARGDGIRLGRRQAEESLAAQQEAARLLKEKTEARLAMIKQIGQLCESVNNLAQAAYRALEEIHN